MKTDISTTFITTQTLDEGRAVVVIYRRERLYYLAITGPSCPWLQHLDDAVYGTYAEAQERLAAEVRQRTAER